MMNTVVLPMISVHAAAINLDIVMRDSLTKI